MHLGRVVQRFVLSDSLQWGCQCVPIELLLGVEWVWLRR